MRNTHGAVHAPGRYTFQVNLEKMECCYGALSDAQSMRMAVCLDVREVVAV